VTRDLELRWGYTLADVERLTRIAVSHDRNVSMDYRTRWDTAYSAVTLALYEAEEPPHREALIRAGWTAIYREAQDRRRQRGYQDAVHSTPDPRDNLRPRCAIYWDQRTVAPSHEERILEQVSAVQVLEVLGTPYLEAILALAAADAYQPAADLLGISYKALNQRIRVARRAILAALHGDETPYLPYRVDQRSTTYVPKRSTHCSKGHEWTDENTQIRRRMIRGRQHVSRVCRACSQDKGRRRRASKRRGVAA
jgi:hypothetical protein